jgi:hypothetical protein
VASRSTAVLRSTLENNLLAYATAASAASLGIIALAVPAQAEVVYKPAHVMIGTGGVRIYYLDIDGDADDDVSFSAQTAESHNPRLNGGGVTYGKKIEVAADHYGYARALPPGGKIGKRKPFDLGNTGHLMGSVATQGRKHRGQWVNVKDRFLGVKFVSTLDGKEHFGWARLKVQFGDNHSVFATLTGYAYETIPGKTIVAGDKGTGAKSLGHLALGAAETK